MKKPKQLILALSLLLGIITSSTYAESSIESVTINDLFEISKTIIGEPNEPCGTELTPLDLFVDDLPFITVTPVFYDFDTVLMNTCSESVPFVIKNIGGEIATGYFDMYNFLQYSMSSPPGSFSINPGDSLIVYIQYCPVSLDGTGNTLYISGTGNTNDAQADMVGWTYCKKIIAIANPSYGGIATPQSQFIFNWDYYKCVDAEANPGFEFVNWELDGIEVSTNPHYCADYYGTCVFEPYVLIANFQYSGPHINVIPTSHNFGEVEVGSDSTFTFELTNNGTSTATGVISIEGEPFPSATMFSVSGGNFSLEPGESHFYDITFNPMENQGYYGVFPIEGYGNCNSDTVTVSGIGVIHVNVTTETLHGTTTGDGIYAVGETCCINAFPDPGYFFDHWEELLLGAVGPIFTPEYCFSPVYWYGDYQWRAYIFPFSFQLKVYLSGIFNGIDMNAYPFPDSFPLNQPYNTDPWGYEGEESVGSLPNSDIVDWVLVELRDPPGNASTAIESTRVARQAAFLLKDGSIVGLDGSSSLSFEVEFSTNFHIVIWHRNHLGVLSASPLSGVTIAYEHTFSYDFADKSNKVYGGELAQKELATGIWGMIGADGDANGTIDTVDKNGTWAGQAGESGYKSGDFNLNGNVDNEDKNEIWLTNTGYSSQLPTGVFSCGGQLYDVRDGQTYNTVQIGNQCWMAENLNIGTMLNGSSNQSNNGTIEKYCYDDITDYCNTYGGLYQWNEMMEYITTEGTQGICPTGWYLPTDDEWKILEGTVDSQYPVGNPIWNTTNYRGYDAAVKLKSTSGWYSNGNGTDDFGFSALPGGRFHYSGIFDMLLSYGNFWSSTKYDTDYSWFRTLYSGNPGPYRGNHHKNTGRSVRCLKDEEPPTWSCGHDLIDTRDLKSYNTVQIGNQCWMAENLDYGTRVDFTTGQENNGIIEKFCFNNEDDSCSVYGGIYQWDELMDYITTEGSIGICPEGWHVPTDGEWCVLENETDSETILCDSEGWRGIDAGGSMKETGYSHWSQPNTGATNSSSFTGLPAGYFNFSQEDILGLGWFSQYWTSTEFSTDNPWMRGLHYSKATIRRINQSKDYGLSLRCIKD